ncbi:MAG: NAD-dependent malic enzyme [Steroidobacteraceae bacterium]
MEVFDLRRSLSGDRLRVKRRGTDLLRFPLYNKGTGFTREERRRLGIEALLPAQYNDIDTQARRIVESMGGERDAFARYLDLAALQDRNEVLFYKVLSLHLESLMPIVYTPTVGKACQHYSHVFRRGRGLFITPDHLGRMEEVIRAAAPYAGVRLMVVTDNEAILGIGDQGAGGMAISVGKLALYCVGAGIHPARTLPISLDVGTDNRALLDDPLYLGYRSARLRGDAYQAFVEEFVGAARAVFPDVIIQWEDLSKHNALAVLDRYRTVLPSFNDDIQGTGAVASACMRVAHRITGVPLDRSRVLIYGAGAAGLGIARQWRRQLQHEGMSEDGQASAILVMDSRGVISTDRPGLESYKCELAWPAERVASLGLAPANHASLTAVVSAFRPSALIGASGQSGVFDEQVVRAMAAGAGRPIILPMSNPTALTEALPADLERWTGGTALYATGSPFDPVATESGLRPVSQANNVFVFPGIGLGAMICNAREITGSMIGAASTALAACVTDAEMAQRRLLPDLPRLWDVCGVVAEAVAQQAIADGVARIEDTRSVPGRLESERWRAAYPIIEAE